MLYLSEVTGQGSAVSHTLTSAVVQYYMKKPEEKAGMLYGSQQLNCVRFRPVCVTVHSFEQSCQESADCDTQQQSPEAQGA